MINGDGPPMHVYVQTGKDPYPDSYRDQGPNVLLDEQCRQRRLISVQLQPQLLQAASSGLQLRLYLRLP